MYQHDTQLSTHMLLFSLLSDRLGEFLLQTVQTFYCVNEYFHLTIDFIFVGDFC